MNKPKVLLDSGAYTVSRKGKVIDIDKYAEYIESKGKIFEGYFNLDVIGNGEASYQNWKYLKKNGINTIPVYHDGSGPQWLKKYLDETDYIGLGAIANLNTNLRIHRLDELWKGYLLDPKTKEPRVKVHGLGLTTVKMMTRFPWYSVDSFTPVISAVWGSVLLPLIKDGQFDYLDMVITKISDQANAKAGTVRSFHAFQHDKSRYEDLTKRLGFEIGQTTYQKQNPRRGKKDKEGIEPEKLFDLTKPADTSVKTLANHWEERMRWNLTMWTRLQKRLPEVKMFMGVSTTTHLEIFNQVTPHIDILISYAYLNDILYKMIKQYVQ